MLSRSETEFFFLNLCTLENTVHLKPRIVVFYKNLRVYKKVLSYQIQEQCFYNNVLFQENLLIYSLV